ncbi:MAG: hypothetical protein ABJN65_07215 [Parasphingorhabdus sp.]
MEPTELISMATPNSYWLLATAAIALIISLIEAWIVSLIYYLRVQFLKKIFPSPHQLIRSHVDYCIMAGLLGLFFVSVEAVDIVLPNIILILICVGALYNPAPFILVAMKPEGAESRKDIDLLGGIVICIGFLPVTIGYGYTSFAILAKLFG